MLPDPTTLRGAAGVLAALGDDLRATVAGVAGLERTTRWAAPVVDALRHELAVAAADGEQAGQDLTSAASHLRALASALEELLSASARAHDARERELRARLSGPGPGAGEAARALAALPGPQDLSWAGRAAVAPPALPLPGGVPVRPVIAGPSGLVTADVPGVRGLGAFARQAGRSAATTARTAAARVDALGLPALDAYGLAGSRSAAWLAGLGAAGSPAARAAAGWEDAGRRCLALADLLERTDAGRLLGDPRLGLALTVAVAPDPAAARAALAGLGAADAAWVADLLRGPPVPVARPRRAPHWPDWLHPSWLDWGAFGTDVTLLPGDVAGRLAASAAAVRAQAHRLERAAAAGSAAARVEAERLRRESRQLWQRSLRTGLWMGRFSPPDWLRGLAETPLVDVPVLRGLSRLGALGTVLGLGLDLREGTSLPLAVAKAAAGALAGVGVAAGVAGALAGAPLLVTGVAVLVAAGVAGMAASWLVERVASARARRAAARRPAGTGRVPVAPAA